MMIYFNFFYILLIPFFFISLKGFEYNYFLSGSFPKHVITYINIGNYFKNTDFFEKEVILKTIKQILTIVIPIVVGSILLVALLVFIVYVLYKKSRAMKVSC